MYIGIEELFGDKFERIIQHEEVGNYISILAARMQSEIDSFVVRNGLQDGLKDRNHPESRNVNSEVDN